jgi:DNA topoisomerase IB
MASRAGLIYVSDALAGYRRERAGRGFRYFLPDNRELKAPAELKRIARLAIPPAYENVWVCMDPRGHLQATGRDARGRKQYRYHPQWRTVRDDAKFDRMTTFAEALPRLRRRLARDLTLAGLPREKVLAAVISILDATRVRVGNVEYARDNKSFGLTTLLNRHVSFIRDGRAVLNFRGKGGVQHEVLIDDKRIVKIMRHCQELPAHPSIPGRSTTTCETPWGMISPRRTFERGARPYRPSFCSHAHRFRRRPAIAPSRARLPLWSSRWPQSFEIPQRSAESPTSTPLCSMLGGRG